MMNQNGEQVVQYMLKLIAAKDQKVVAKTIEAFDGVTSKSTIYNYLKELCSENIICNSGSTSRENMRSSPQVPSFW